MKNENKQEDMISTLEHLTKYVPFTTEDEVLDETSNTMVPLINHQICDLLLGGDQLTIERFCGVHRTRDNTNEKLDLLKSFKGVVEDWHLGVAVMIILLFCMLTINKFYYAGFAACVYNLVR